MVELNASQGLKLTPTSVPTASEGTIYYDSGDHTLKICNNGNNFNTVGADAIPIGTIFAWIKSFSNTPALNNKWVECNGQTLSDAESVYNGLVIPNLNGTTDANGRFLQGRTTSGIVGGSETYSHGHTGVAWPANGGTAGNDPISAVNASSTYAIPPYYSVVWILKVK